MCDDQDALALRERQRREYQLTEAQHTRFREFLNMPAETWPEALQRRVLIAIDLDGLTRETVEWTLSDYVRRAN